ncbi:uncharacterized protein [Lolium perenne]|uniref:uncharacterized protein n=1 Tax=Lolium perenne TaxID=4522 RepID=UPI0021F66643|nr:uncharacterized protein LOC127316015 [Lolium perenne]
MEYKEETRMTHPGFGLTKTQVAVPRHLELLAHLYLLAAATRRRRLGDQGQHSAHQRHLAGTVCHGIPFPHLADGRPPDLLTGRARRATSVGHDLRRLRESQSSWSKNCTLLLAPRRPSAHLACSSSSWTPTLTDALRPRATTSAIAVTRRARRPRTKSPAGRERPPSSSQPRINGAE